MKKAKLTITLISALFIFLLTGCSQRERVIDIELDTDTLIKAMISEEGSTVNAQSSSQLANVKSMVAQEGSLMYVSTSGAMGTAPSVISLLPEAQDILLGETYNTYDIIEARVLFVFCVQCAGGRKYGLILQYKLFGQTNFKTAAFESQAVTFSEDYVEIPMSPYFSIMSYDVDPDFEEMLSADLQLLVITGDGEVTGKFPTLINR